MTLKGSHVIAWGKQTAVCAAPGCRKHSDPEGVAHSTLNVRPLQGRNRCYRYSGGVAIACPRLLYVALSGFRGEATRSLRLQLALEIPAASGVAAIAINLYGVARAFAGRATVFAAVGRRTATGWVLTGSFLLIVRHLASSSSEFELPVVWRSTLSHSAAGLEAVWQTSPAVAFSDCIKLFSRPIYNT
jgi:hypothetical protein